MESPIPAWQRALSVSELRDMIFKVIASPRIFCRLLQVSHAFTQFTELATTSLYDPCIFASQFFSQAGRFIDLVRENRAIMTGYSVRQFMYGFNVGRGWLVIMANERNAELFTEFIMDQGYKRYDTRMFEQRLCRRPTVIHRFKSGTKYVTVHFAVHEPMRLLLATTRPFALQACDGWRFMDLYPCLGAEGPRAALAHGRHTHLLDARECIENLPLQTFALSRDAPDDPAVSFVERWIGDGKTWIAPNTALTPSRGHLERHGWTIRLFAQREGTSPFHQFWTDTTSRCLRHHLLVESYVVPPPALLFVTRILDRMQVTLKTMSKDEIRGPGDRVIISFDEELDIFIQHYRDKVDYTYTEGTSSITVAVADCTYTMFDD